MISYRIENHISLKFSNYAIIDLYTIQKGIFAFEILTATLSNHRYTYTYVTKNVTIKRFFYKRVSSLIEPRELVESI